MVLDAMYYNKFSYKRIHRRNQLLVQNFSLLYSYYRLSTNGVVRRDTAVRPIALSTHLQRKTLMPIQ